MPGNKLKELIEKQRGMQLRDNTATLTGDQMLRMQKGAGLDPLKDLNKDKDVYIKGDDANIHQMKNIDQSYLDSSEYADYLPTMIKMGIKPMGDGAYTPEQIKAFMIEEKARQAEFDPTKPDENDPRNFQKLMGLMKK